MNYKFTNNEKSSVYVIENDGSCCKSVLIKYSSDNTDYQEYLKWVAEGNQPLPADE
jgi:hypothetical protein